MIGAFAAVRRAVSLPPAEAMRPEAPASFRETLIERIGLRRFLPPPARMVLRNVARHPLRSTMSVVGIAFGVAILVVGLFFLDSIEELLRVQFTVVQRQDVTTTFVEPVSAGAMYELERLPGVIAVEPVRTLPVRIRAGHRFRQTALTGLPPAPALNRVVDRELQPVTLPPSGLVMSSSLASALAVRAGDDVVIEVLEGTRPVRRASIARLVDEFMGMSVYMDIAALRQLMREAGSLSGGYLRIDTAQAPALYERLKRTPLVAGVALKQAAVESFRKTIQQNMSLMIVFNVVFACIIAFGVVYNAARIALSERSRDLASLRVLGFTRREVSTILLGELAVIVLAALPVGLLLGQGFAALVVKGVESELYRFPLTVSMQTRLFAMGTVLVAAVLSGLVVRSRVDHLDLVAVLKTRD
jgi:putative ABC transport system permease protein